MTKKQIKSLVTASYKNGQLNEKFITGILLHLSRSDLKSYIKELKRFEEKSSITIVTASPLSEKYLKKMSTLYPSKKIYVEVNPSLILGVRIIDADMVYSENLEDTLNTMVTYVSEI